MASNYTEVKSISLILRFSVLFQCLFFSESVCVVIVDFRDTHILFAEWWYVEKLTPEQEGLLSLTAQRAACKTWNAHPSYLGSGGTFKPKFYGNGVMPCPNVDTVR